MAAELVSGFGFNGHVAGHVLNVACWPARYVTAIGPVFELLDLVTVLSIAFSLSKIGPGLGPHCNHKRKNPAGAGFMLLGSVDQD